MALQQPNSTVVWTEQKDAGAALEVTEMAFVDRGNGAHELRELLPGEDPSLLWLDKGNGAFESVTTAVNTGDDPELRFIQMGSGAIITYE